MAAEHSFDIVSKVDLNEVDNAINQTLKEIHHRYDFKGTNTKIDLDRGKNEVTVLSDDEFKLKNVHEVLKAKLANRKVPVRALQYGKVEAAAGSSARQVISLQQGIPTENAREIVKLIKTNKLKIQGEIQKDQVRVRAKKIDDLQTFMSLLKEKDMGIHMEFVNYR